MAPYFKILATEHTPFACNLGQTKQVCSQMQAGFVPVTSGRESPEASGGEQLGHLRRPPCHTDSSHPQRCTSAKGCPQKGQVRPTAL